MKKKAPVGRRVCRGGSPLILLMENLTKKGGKSREEVHKAKSFNDSRVHVERTLNFFFRPGGTFEVRLIGPKIPKSPLWKNERTGGGKAVTAGWFRDPSTAAETVVGADTAVLPAEIYRTLNSVCPALPGRANNRLKAAASRIRDEEVSFVRHFKIYVTKTRRGGSAEDRPHRYARILYFPHSRKDFLYPPRIG